MRVEKLVAPGYDAIEVIWNDHLYEIWCWPRGGALCERHGPYSRFVHPVDDAIGHLVAEHGIWPELAESPL